MKFKFKWVLILAVIALFASVTTVLANTNQLAKMHEFFGDDGAPIVDPQDIDRSTVVLIRGKDGVQINVTTSELPVGAYTNWWIIWNDPEADCTSGDAPLLCGLGDISKASVFFATGGVTNNNGDAHFRAALDEGGIPAGLNDLDNSNELDQVRIDNGGLGDAQTAEIHYIIRYHGPASEDPDDLAKQTSTINFLCGTVVPLGACFDPQALGFVAP